MIFITVGSAFPFDRLIKSMDTWAAETGRGEECLAQIGRGTYQPTHMEWHRTLEHAHFAETMKSASVVVAHAGMGSVITAMQHGIPIVMLPRHFEAGEHTTDHQIATARWLEDKPGVFIAWDETSLEDAIAKAEVWSSTGSLLASSAPITFTTKLNEQLSRWLET